MIKKMTYLAFSVAMLLLFTFTPFLGYIQINVVSITLIPSIVMIISIIFIKIMKWPALIAGIISGLLLGLSSLMASFVFAGSFDVLFQNPLFSIGPRLLVGLISGLTLTILKFGPKFKFLTCLIWVFTVITSNTVLTVTTIYWLADYFFPYYKDLKNISWLLIVTNYLPELIVTTLIIFPVLRFFYRN